MADMQASTPISGLVVVANAGAGDGSAAALRDTMARVWHDAGLDWRFVEAAAGEPMTVQAQRAAHIAQELDAAVVAVGGDGTINAVAQAAWAEQVPMGVVPGGTFNYLARDRRIPLDVEQACRVVMDGRIAAVRPGLVNGHVFMVNASVGLYRQLLEDREAFKQKFGRSRGSAAVAGVLSLLNQRVQLRLNMEQDGRHRHLRTPSLFIGSNRLQLEQLGLPVAEQMSEDQLGAIIVRPVDSLRLFGLAVRGALGSLGDAEHLDAFPVRELRVSGFGRRSIKVAMDGEVMRLPLPLEFSRARQPLRLIVPGPDKAAPRR